MQARGFPQIRKIRIEYSPGRRVHSEVKTNPRPSAWLRHSMLLVVAGFALSSVSCVTTYDTMGRPVQTVDPAVAVAGVAAAGVLGYALANDHHHHHGGYYGGYQGGYYRPYGRYCR